MAGSAYRCATKREPHTHIPLVCNSFIGIEMLQAQNLLRYFIRRLQWVILFIFFIAVINVLLMVQLPSQSQIIDSNEAIDKFFSLRSSKLGCLVPNFPLFNDDFNRIYGFELEWWRRNEFSCNSVVDVINLNMSMDQNGLLSIRSASSTFDKCLIRCISREGDNDVVFQEAIEILLHQPKPVSCEFFRMACYRNTSLVHADLYSSINLIDQVQSYKTAPESGLNSVPTETTRPFNVLIFGMDGVSRQNFLRLMTKTRQVLENSTAFVDFEIYNKVRDNTFVNIIPMLTGKFVDELPWNETISMQKSFDDFPFAWNLFKQLNYTTIYAEDFAEISIFNYLKKGFENPPADYYFRPMNLAMDADKDSWHGDSSLCFKNKFEVDYVLQYVRSAMIQGMEYLFKLDCILLFDYLIFLAKLKSQPYFGFVYLTRITHEEQPLATVADGIYSKFLKQLKDDNLLDDNTIVYLVSDHGTRWGNYRTSLYGKYEERLPVFAMGLPRSRIQNDRPDIFTNVKVNSKKLVTPFDIYYSLVDIAKNFPTKSTTSNKQRGRSLFRKMPPGRTCQQAGIDQHWCACHDSVKLAANEHTDLGMAIAEHLNRKVLSQVLDKCSQWNLREVAEVRLLKPNDKFFIFKQSVNDVNDRTELYEKKSILTKTKLAIYLVTVVFQNKALEKGGGGVAIFEATVHARIGTDGGRKNIIVEGLSRLNSYGQQSACLATHSLKPFCFCR